MASLNSLKPLADEIDRFALQYSYGETEKFHWTLRGIRRDGDFYGEVRLNIPLINSHSKPSKLLGVIRWIQSKPLTIPECATVFENFEAILRLPPAQRVDKSKPLATRQGCIVPNANSDYLYLYFPEFSTTPAADRHFLNITAILHPYLSPFEQQCRDLVPAAFQRGLNEMSETPEKPSIFRRLLGWKFLL